MTGWVWVYIIGLAVIFVLMWILARSLGQVNAVFQEVGRELDLSATGTGRTSREALSIAGTIDGMLVSAEFRNEAGSRTGTGPGRRYYTVLRAGITGPSCDFTITKSAGFVANVDGAQMFLDDADFDQDTVTGTPGTDSFRAYMTEDRRRVARNLILRFDDCTIDQTAINVERNGAKIEPAALQDDLRLVAAAAALLNVERP